MNTLYVLRHAKSSWEDPSLEDRDRPLAARGIKAAHLVSEYFDGRRLTAELVLCSSAVRARQTLEIVIPALAGSHDVRIEDGLYAAGVAGLLDRLRLVDESVRSVLLVGHNPGLQLLALDLVADGEATAVDQLRRKFPTAALATVTTETPWEGLDAAVGYLESLVIPRAMLK
jgi:phosphohistidine phosphatase